MFRLVMTSLRASLGGGRGRGVLGRVDRSLGRVDRSLGRVDRSPVRVERSSGRDVGGGDHGTRLRRKRRFLVSTLPLVVLT